MSKRLDRLAELVPNCRLLADVGCDHGYVGIRCLQSGKAEQVVFIDVSEPSLRKARLNCPDELYPRASFLRQDGLGEVAADCAVIAGMGGLEIISILQRATPPKQLVLQPNRNATEVRTFLSQRYAFVYDGMLCDGKYYNMILAELCESPAELTKLQLAFGVTNLSAPNRDFRKYLAEERAKLTKILDNCDDARVRAKLALVQSAIAVVGGTI